MGALSKFETLVEQLMERPFAGLPGASVQPVTMARQLETAMERNNRLGVDVTYAPNAYSIELHPEDFDPYAEAASALSADLAVFATSRAEELGFSLLGPVSVEIVPTLQAERRRPRVHSSFAGSEPAKATAAVERTQLIDLSTLTQVVDEQRLAELVFQRQGALVCFPLRANRVRIGRSLSSDLILDDDTVSRNHAEIRYSQNQFRLIDMNSTNGSTVNGQRVAQSFLENGDQLCLGSFQLEFRLQVLER